MGSGAMSSNHKSSFYYHVWPIRGGLSGAVAITINSGTTTTKTTNVTLALSATDPSGVSGMKISNLADLSDATEETYAATKAWTLTSGADGPRTVYAKFKDTLGNWSSVYNAQITLDTVAPATIITAKPPATDTSRSATFSFSSEAGATFQCQFDSEAFSACTSPKSYTDLAPGSHTFTVKASDAAGNVETVGTQNTWQWNITTLLTISRNGTGGGSIAPNTGTITWTNNSGTATYNSGTVVTLTATADSGSTFSGWTGVCSGTGTCQVTMDAAKNVTATFTYAPVSGVCGTSNGQTFSTAPVGNLCSGGGASSVTGTGPWSWSCNGAYGGASATCSANLQAYTVTPTSGSGGSISCTPTTVSSGATSTCTITPNSGIKLSEDGKTLFVAHLFGLRAVDTASGKLTDIARMHGDPIEYPFAVTLSKDHYVMSSWFTGTVQLLNRKDKSTKAMAHGLAAPMDAVELADGRVLV